MNREQLAWVAGFFDGEGSLGFYDTATARGLYRSKKLILQVSQKDPSLLYRVVSVVGFGKVRGPYLKGRKHEVYRYTVQDFEHIQALIAMVWPWLGDPKRCQARGALGAAKQWRRRDEEIP